MKVGQTEAEVARGLRRVFARQGVTSYFHVPVALFGERTAYPGAFGQFSAYFCERYEELPPERLQGLAWLLSECMADPESDLDDAASSGFLENVAAERFHGDFERYLIGRPLEFYAQWGDGL